MNGMSFIEKTNELGSRLGLDSIKELLKRLGNPQDKCKVIHIAGTNGKGSIFAFVEGIYKAAGYLVGRYISPTVFTYLERFQINGKYMDEDCFERLCQTVQKVYFEMEKEGCLLPTSFEVETAIAFLYFAYENVDVVLLETGMGGREDATNVVKTPLLNVFASISYDHMEFLGDTLEKIVHEKAGILREGGKAVAYPMILEAKAALEKECQQKKVTLKYPRVDQIYQLESGVTSQRFTYKGEEYDITLLGEHQIYNAATALEIVDTLKERYPVTLEVIKEGLKKVKWPCRFEIMETNPYVVRDGAHNIDAIKELKKTLLQIFPDKKYAFVVGVFKDKEHEKMWKEILPIASLCYTVTAPGPRGMNKNLLSEEIKGLGFQAQSCENVKEAISLAKQKIGKENLVVIFGSLSFIGRI